VRMELVVTSGSEGTLHVEGVAPDRGIKPLVTANHGEHKSAAGRVRQRQGRNGRVVDSGGKDGANESVEGIKLADELDGTGVNFLQENKLVADFPVNDGETLVKLVEGGRFMHELMIPGLETVCLGAEAVNAEVCDQLVAF